MTGYQGDSERNAEAMAGGWYHTGDVATRDERRLHHLRRPHRRRVQGQRLQDQPVRARVGAHRAPRRGRGRGGARPGCRAPGGAQGVRRARARSRADGGDRALDPRSTPARTSRRGSGCAAWSSPSCRRRSPARSAGSSCGPARRTSPAGDGAARGHRVARRHVPRPQGLSAFREDVSGDAGALAPVVAAGTAVVVSGVVDRAGAGRVGLAPVDPAPVDERHVVVGRPALDDVAEPVAGERGEPAVGAEGEHVEGGRLPDRAPHHRCRRGSG